MDKKVLFDLLAGMKDNSEPVSFIGAKIMNPADLAKLAEVVRSPRYETFHYIFTKNNEVKGTTAVSCRLASSTMTTGGHDREMFYKELLRRAKSVGADSFYFLHNHPSGNPTPSIQDISFTQELAKEISDKANITFGGHVVINSSQYALIDQQGNYEILPINYNNSYKLDEMRKADSFFNTCIRGPEDFAACAKLMQKSEKSFYMVGLTARNLCNCLYQVSYDILKKPAQHLIDNIRQWSYSSGVDQYALINFDSNKIDDYRKNIFFRQLGKSGYVLDIITKNGISLRSQDKFQTTYSKKMKTVHQVHEYNNKYEQSSVKFSPLRTWLSKQNLSHIRLTNDLNRAY